MAYTSSTACQRRMHISSKVMTNAMKTMNSGEVAAKQDAAHVHLKFGHKLDSGQHSSGTWVRAAVTLATAGPAAGQQPWSTCMAEYISMCQVHLDCSLARRALLAAYEHAVWRREVRHRRALREELWVAQDLELGAGHGAVAAQDLDHTRLRRGEGLQSLVHTHAHARVEGRGA